MLSLQDAPSFGAIFSNNHPVAPAFQEFCSTLQNMGVVLGDEHLSTRTIRHWFQRMKRRRLTSAHWPALEEAASEFPDFARRIAATMAEISVSKEANTHAACSRSCFRPRSSSS